MTPEQARTLAQPITEIYEELTDELMEAIAAQLATHGDITDTARWQLQKLAEAGQLNDRVIKTIAERTAVCPELTELLLQTASRQAVSALEPMLQAAALQGLAGKSVDTTASPRMLNALQAYRRQAKDTYNLVNTVMAYKARNAYTGIVNKTADMANRIEYLSILGKNTASVITGQQTRQSALRRCIKEFADKGLPGFVDKAGREWTPEAYLNMDIRTTVNNVAHETQFGRMEDYGCDLVMVSSHIGARPRCEPFQGRLFSMSGKSGTAKDLNGNSVPYSPWSGTSYGEASGLLGINCGHQIYPFFPGFSTMTYQPYPKAENSKRYEESQRQRYLERQVRAAKRECIMLDKFDDRAGFAAASQRLKQRTQALNDFAATTGRSVKRDRLQVAGFDRRISSKTKSTATTSLHDIGIKPTLITPKAINSVPLVDSSFFDAGDLQTLHKSLLKEAAKYPLDTEVMRSYSMEGHLLLERIGAGGRTTLRVEAQPFFAMHNHPDTNTFSSGDIKALAAIQHLCGISAVGNNGAVYLAEKMSDYDPQGFKEYYRQWNEAFDMSNMTVSAVIAEIERLLGGAAVYGIKYTVVR